MEKINRKNLLIVWSILVFFAIISLVILQYFNFSEYNQIRAFQSSRLMISETEQIIAENDTDRDDFQSTLKRNYLEKARIASYIIDTLPDVQSSPEELQKIARVLGVDQIHLFDERGRESMR